MIIEIADVDDFYAVVRPAYDDLLQEPGDEPATLEVVLAPGEYRHTSLTFGDDLDTRPIHLVLRGADPAHPPQFTDLSLNVCGREVRLQDLVLKHIALNRPILHARVRDSLVIDRCAFIANRSAAPPEGRLIDLVAGGDDGQTTVTIQNSWFIRNRAPDSSIMLACDAPAPHHFAHVRFENVAFLDNHVEFSIAPYRTETLEVSNCVLYEPLESGAEAPVFMAITSTASAFSIDRSLFVNRCLERLVTRWSSREPRASAFRPVVVRNSELFVRDLRANGPGLEGVILLETSVQPAAPIDAHADEVSLLIDRWIAQAEQGVAPDPAMLKAAFGTLLRPS